MKLPSRHFRAVAAPLVSARACCAALALAALAARAQTAAAPAPAPGGDDVITLSEFQVSTSADKGYRAGNAVAATRIDTPIKDLPFSVSAFTEQFITDIGARELPDVVVFAPGVTSGAKEFTQGNTRFSIRGFDGDMTMRIPAASYTGTESGTMFFYREDGTDWYYFGDTEPGWAGASNVRELGVDFSGFGFVIGIIVRL